MPRNMDGGIRIFGAFSNIDMDKRIQGADIKKGKENNFALSLIHI